MTVNGVEAITVYMDATNTNPGKEKNMGIIEKIMAEASAKVELDRLMKKQSLNFIRLSRGEIEYSEIQETEREMDEVARVLDDAEAADMGR